MCYLHFRETGKADERLKGKREQIEGELLRMVTTIEQELKASRNVIGMLERFRGNAGEALKGELDVLLADMRSSNYEAALTRFEAMLSSPIEQAALSEIFNDAQHITSNRRGNQRGIRKESVRETAKSGEKTEKAIIQTTV